MILKPAAYVELRKGNECYAFIVADDSRAEAMRTFGRFASNPELSFNWYDAAFCSAALRRSIPETCEGK